MVFFVLLFIPMIIQHVVIRSNYTNHRKRNQGALAFFFFFLTALLMFRHASVGNDTRNYLNHFRVYSQLDWIDVGRTTNEFGYSYLNKIISVFSKNPQFFLATVAVMTTLLIYPTYKRLCIDSSLTIMLFVSMPTFVMMFSGMRQMVAIGIGFLAYEFTRNKKLIPYIVSVSLAVSFHTSAIMLVLMYPLYHAKITKKWMYLVIPVLTLVFVYNQTIFLRMSSVIERYTKYDGSITSTGAYTMIILFALFSVFSYIIPDEKVLDEETIGLRNFLLFALVIQMFAPLHTLAMRMNYYYIIFIPLLIPKIIKYRSERWKQVAVISRHVMVAFFLVYFFLNANSGGNLHVFPYHFFWE